ncbi:MAG: Uma2 family endonuclease [Saprospiraceae bacterium]|nr:Uma2 family endonuclease [Saprospiraceae bacterium]MCF8250037.1 Uma2 family endonuclease [Saprospiraceae bacterium]MCF8278923.1 Uma2 family endonuclease [Bacteroidales bacterium]MCF8311050.1 Uma2 family endonuclease [Saprospiraceae bacterium]MCF8439614.1 Uma2 family endonuclease [Saprospiraceae bacterium]
MTATLEISDKLYTVKEWLEIEKKSEVKHEFYYGKLIPMAGESKQANNIAGNFKRNVEVQLFEKGFLIFDHDVKTEVASSNIYRYPDLVVAPEVDDEDDYIVKHPVLLAEVASQNSRHRDRVRKRREYFNVESLWYYLVVMQDEMLVELHSKREDGSIETQWFTEPADIIEPPKFELKIVLSDIYWRIKLKD